MDLDPSMVDFPHRFEHASHWWTVVRPGQAFDDSSQIRRGELPGSCLFDAVSDAGASGQFVYIRNDQCFVYIHPREVAQPSVACSMLPFAEACPTLQVEGQSLLPPDIRSEREKYHIRARARMDFVPSQPLCRMKAASRDSESSKVPRQFLGPLLMKMLRNGFPPAVDTRWMRQSNEVRKKSPEYLKGMVDAYAMMVGKPCLRVMTAENIPGEAMGDPSVVAAAARIETLYKTTMQKL